MIWILLEFSLDRSDSQKPQRTSPLVNVPRYPMKARTDWNGSKEMEDIEVESDDVVMAPVLYLSVWYCEDVSSAESTVDDIANSVLSIS